MVKPNIFYLLTAWMLLVISCTPDKGKKSVKDVFAANPNVMVFEPGNDAKVQQVIDSVFDIQGHPRNSEFTERRVAFLFTPGRYELDVKVGYYTQVLGLGSHPDDVTIVGSMKALAPPDFNGSVLINFWRGVENLSVIPVDSTNVWAVSQAAPMRRVHIQGDLQVHDMGPASGGFLANSKVDGTIFFGPQQQWFTRNSNWSEADGGIWNIMTVGVPGAKHNWPEGSYHTIDKTRKVREKPYLQLVDDELVVVLPAIHENSEGVRWTEEGQIIGLDQFYIAYPDQDDSKSINEALKAGKHLLMTPGVYWLEENLHVSNPNTILHGIGLPTLIPTNGTSAIEIADVDGITLSGIVVDAGLEKSERLVEFGPSESSANHAENPSLITDLFVRVGGYHAGMVDHAVVINSSDVILDHAWIWRADHGEGVGWDVNRAKNGLIVNGDRVISYGLFNEHFQEYQTIWNGEDGDVYFYQNEMPYYVPDPEAWKHGDTYGYASYKVGDHVKSHRATGLGIYNVFFKSGAISDNAIETPEAVEADIQRIVTIWLGGNEESEVRSVINGKGEGVNKDHRKTVY